MHVKDAKEKKIKIKREVINMPRRKKEIVNALENLNAADVNSIHDMESDEIVLKEFNEEDAAAAMEMLNEMDERKRIDASRSKKEICIPMKAMQAWTMMRRMTLYWMSRCDMRTFRS